MIILFLSTFIVLLCQATSSTAVFSNQKEGEKLIRANTEFALNLYRSLSSDKDAEGDNVFFSPLSISMALAMTYLGARNQTAEQMADVLKFGQVNPNHLHSSFSDLGDSLISGDNFTLNIANKLYGQESYGFLEEFLAATRNYYKAGLEQVDFVADTEAARQLINGWVESQTNEKIKELIGGGDISPATVFVLVNAVYFKGDWSQQFDPDDTEEGDFTLENGKTTKVSMMEMRDHFNYGFSRMLNAKALELPYKGDKLSMVVLLPEQADGITALENALTVDHLLNFEMYEYEVSIYLPRFKLEDSFFLGDTLKSMGMTDAFSSGADFSGMTGSRGLFISKIIHKSFIEVNEEGSEAAAATAVINGESGSKFPLVFKADHPFVFFIRDNDSKAILFFGKFANPQ